MSLESFMRRLSEGHEQHHMTVRLRCHCGYNKRFEVDSLWCVLHDTDDDHSKVVYHASELLAVITGFMSFIQSVRKYNRKTPLNPVVVQKEVEQLLQLIVDEGNPTHRIDPNKICQN